MSEAIPESKWKRAAVGGKTAAQVGGKVLRYLAKKPFLPAGERENARENLERDSARDIFKGLVLLKGTALKIAQLLSFELDLVPEAVRKELEKSYNQVPPINRALVRKMIQNAFGETPENLFGQFDHKAFAAASLGQVHRATDKSGRVLAVKIQYPGMETTIKNDLQIVRNLARATPYARFVVPVLEEIEIKLGEEIDYYQEAENTTFFNENLKESHTVVPGVVPELSARAVLTTDYLEGISLDQWMALKPTQEERDRVAATLLNQFQKGLFDLRRVHADPNPGNFIVMESLDIGLIDFGCVKRFSDDFIQLFIETSRAIVDGSGERYLDYLKQMRVIRADIDPEVEGRIYEAFKKSSDWFCQLYQSDTFDFGENAGFILEGKRLMREMFQFRKYFQPNPEFVFLNRTNYGLIRIFEKLNARVRFINPHEWRLS